MKKLLQKIKNKNCKIFVAGCGYTGLPISIKIASKKIKTFGFDINLKLINKLKNKYSNRYLTFTNKINYISKADIILIALPTPLTKNYDPDLSYIQSFLNDSKKYLRKNQILILESTSYPGTTNEIVRPLIEKKFNIGKNFYLGYSPERIDPGRNVQLNKITKVYSGCTKNCKIIINSFYRNFIDKTFLVSRNETAEFVKIFENIFRAVNISLVNEMKIIADVFNINIREVINAAETKPYGFMRFDPGPGIGGHCIPVDPFYLTWKAKEFGIHTRFIELAGEVNNKIPLWTYNKINENLNKKNKYIKNSNFLFIGASYKKDISDIRESPSIKFFKLFMKEKIKFDYYDPHVKNIHISETKKKLKSVSLNASKLKKYDCVVILTNHSKINYEQILKYSKIIFDTRGCLPKNSKVINL